jgi:hypothetical protein
MGKSWTITGITKSGSLGHYYVYKKEFCYLNPELKKRTLNTRVHGTE